MTKDNPVAAGVAELLPCPFCGCSDIEIIGRSIDCRACHAGFYVDKDESPVDAWNRRAASPVQAGIDPLVAEIEAGLEGLPACAWRTETAWPADYAGYVVCGFFGETPHMPRLPQAQAFVVTDDDFDDDLNVAMAQHVARCSPDNIAKLIAGYRSQAERIAALEDWNRLRAEDIMTLGKQVGVAESLLAEAREALEPFSEAFAGLATRAADHEAVLLTWQPGAKSMPVVTFAWVKVSDIRRARTTLSRLKPGEKGGGQ